MKTIVSLVPVGDVRQDVLDAAAGGIYEGLGLEVDFRPAVPLPKEAFAEERSQYRAELLLSYLRTLKGTFPLCLGITSVDIYASDLNFVFGIALLKRGLGLVSYARLDNTFYGLGPNDNLLYQRVAKECLHEIGHALGLEHCENPCVMLFANSLMEVDRKPGFYCEQCRYRLKFLLERWSG